MNVQAGAALLGIDDILSAVSGSLLFPAGSSRTVRSVSIDSRTTTPDALFVALAGERTDGHEHVGQAAERGAAAILVSRAKSRLMEGTLRKAAASHGIAAIAVDDTLAGLQDLARFHMRRCAAVTRLGVTGSNGKTTTKEIIGAILSIGSATAVNEGNLNSEIGLPVSCFSVAPTHRYAVFEMGMNRHGEMDVLADIVRPDLALITNVGTAHIGLLGSKEHIALEKKKIFSRFTGTQTGLLGEDEPFGPLLSSGVNGKIVYYGPRSTRGYRGSESLGLDGTLIHWEGFRIRFPLFGPHNLANALGAIAMAIELGVAPAEVRDGLEAVAPLFGRSQIIRGPVTVVLDCYNANPDSMERALSFIQTLPWTGRKLAVLGAMRELGAESAESHRALGRMLAASSLDGLLLFGDEMGEAWREIEGSPLAGRSAWTADYAVLVKEARALARAGDLILVKGSRGTELERLLPEIQAAEREPRPVGGEASCS
jgi:UDP-N-acetylmuramoyl-tripeptide--D-alanyl-D-alanine ligase